MRFKYNKEDIIRYHPELAEEVISISGLELFVYLDLLVFSAVLGLLLYPLVSSVWLLFSIPVMFFISCSAVFRLICKSAPS
ncbi:hypothetical protein CVD28_17460 [Bacillus sp. M6-12]|uniref:hypothetical protein n=1 Tax=Bacillus sp. M6-12 TaxID=2054166 RepID=UPI000C7790BA|nr:hypothetical protein [Bacillus sp. M6-12]PLS16265.1 hypothetical protein CVD28_17460 [Bacillus sp. M6-12]